MELTDRQRRLLHLAVQRYDAESGAAYLDPLQLAEEMGADLVELTADVDALEAGGYVERATGTEPNEAGKQTAGTAETDEGWALRPTDKGLLTAMGL